MPSPRLFPDTVVVYPRVAGQDVDGGATDSDGTGVAFAASVQRVTSTGNASKREEPYQEGTIAGIADYNVLFNADVTGIVTTPDVRMRWTKHAGVDLPAPVLMTSLGAAEPPGGLMARWTVSAKRVV
jgi:hypothetical protein